jgi:hypothetical protein
MIEDVNALKSYRPRQDQVGNTYNPTWQNQPNQFWRPQQSQADMMYQNQGHTYGGDNFPTHRLDMLEKKMDEMYKCMMNMSNMNNTPAPTPSFVDMTTLMQ